MAEIRKKWTKRARIAYAVLGLLVIFVGVATLVLPFYLSVQIVVDKAVSTISLSLIAGLSLLYLGTVAFIARQGNVLGNPEHHKSHIAKSIGWKLAEQTSVDENGHLVTPLEAVKNGQTIRDIRLRMPVSRIPLLVVTICQLVVFCFASAMLALVLAGKTPDFWSGIVITADNLAKGAFLDFLEAYDLGLAQAEDLSIFERTANFLSRSFTSATVLLMLIQFASYRKKMKNYEWWLGAYKSDEQEALLKAIKYEFSTRFGLLPYMTFWDRNLTKWELLVCSVNEKSKYRQDNDQIFARRRAADKHFDEYLAIFVDGVLGFDTALNSLVVDKKVVVQEA